MKPFFLSILLMYLTACAAERRMPMPELTVMPEMAGAKGCEFVFPRGRWQFVHSIDFSMHDGSGGTVVGVTSLTGDEIACALMTVEGFTLFEAVLREGKGLEVKRAVAPFDKPAFAEGLMRDVQMIFRVPSVGSMRFGRLADNAPTCRYTEVDGRTTDILPTADDCWQIKTYAFDLTMDRFIAGRSCRKIKETSIPAYLELRAFSQSDYTLKMTLLHAEALDR